MALEVLDLRRVGDLPGDVRAAWQRLACAADLPACLPEWMVALHAELAADTPAHVLVAADSEGVAGILPLEVIRWERPGPVLEYRPMGSLTNARVAPLAEAGREGEVALALAGRLHELLGDRAAFLQLEWLDSLSPWVELLHTAWPGPVHERRDGEQLARVVRMDPGGDADRWRAGQSRKFRAEIKQKTRAMGRRGGALRLAGDPARLAGDVRALLELHLARFAATGRSSSLDERHARAILAAAPRMIEDGTMRLWLVDQGDRVVGAHLYFRAGGRMMAWNGGIDPDWTRESLGLLLRHQAVEDAHRLGLRELDLGPGDNASKQRFGNAVAPLVSRSLWPLGPRYPIARARLARKHATQAALAAGARLPPPAKAAIKRGLRR